MKRIISFITVITLSLCFTFLFACKENHTHSWQETSLDNGIMTYTCESCSETKTENKATLYKETCLAICNTITIITTDTQNLNLLSMQNLNLLSTQNLSLLSVNNDIHVEANPEYDYIQVKAAGVFVKLLASLIDNNNFRITDKPVAFTMSDTAYTNEQCDVVLSYIFDEKNNKVTMYWNVISNKAPYTTNIFLYLDVDYDFSTETVTSFEVITYQERYNSNTEVSTTNLINWLYEEGILYGLNKNLTQTQLQPVYDSLQQKQTILENKLSETINLNADFSTEYTNAMIEING